MLLSRMRTHKGNVPSLPQTKRCSLCPAKFTRTTHLNRHLRSHTNERLHRCNLCKTAEFTRSDLLTRHKRTCGQSVTRSRRKSCESCAESKIKCNLQYPCAKCTSRGRECVFLNDPEQSRNKRGGCRKSSSSPQPVERLAPSPSFSPRIPSPSPEDFSATSTPSSYFFSLPALSESGPSSAESSMQSSPRMVDFQSFEEWHPFDFPFDIGVNEDFAAVLSPTSPFDQPLSCHPLSSILFDETKTDCHTVSHDTYLPTEIDGDLQSLSVDDHLDVFASLMRPPSPPVGSCGTLLISQPPISLDYLDALDMQYLSASNSTLETWYLHLFFTRFLAQVPVIHAATWKMADTPPLLVRIFHACGALFVKTPEATMFVETTITSVTAEISEEFMACSRLGNNTIDSSMSCPRIHLIIGLVLLQTICLFLRQEGGPLAAANPQQHAMLVAMIRQTDLIKRVGSWTAPDWSDSISLETAWIKWTRFATIKRALLLAYFHDCCHCMYSAAPPAFSPAELDVHLPCDDALWRASSAVEWLAAVHTPSAYGVGIERIYGVSMQRALKSLALPPGDNSDLSSTGAGHPTLTPFALFLLIHTVLRNIAVAQRAPPQGGWSCFTLVAPQAPSGADFASQTQSMLDNWLQLWLASPDAGLPAQENSATVSGQEPPFVGNSLPFYWLAQVLLWETPSAGSAFGS
ncbi:hypothetical protein B0H19DRAFT_1161593 [Mycena capillaripes]|nr:hypothetical protein B0H19DRAFT_1161593 [Mycena capillaripes]